MNQAWYKQKTLLLKYIAKIVHTGLGHSATCLDRDKASFISPRSKIIFFSKIVNKLPVTYVLLKIGKNDCIKNIWWHFSGVVKDKPTVTINIEAVYRQSSVKKPTRKIFQVIILSIFYPFYLRYPQQPWLNFKIVKRSLLWKLLIKLLYSLPKVILHTSSAI